MPGGVPDAKPLPTDLDQDVVMLAAFVLCLPTEHKTKRFLIDNLIQKLEELKCSSE